MADAAGLDLHQQFARTRARHCDFFDYQGFAECACNCGLHGFVHHCLRSLISFTMLERLGAQDHDLYQSTPARRGSGNVWFQKGCQATRRMHGAAGLRVDSVAAGAANVVN
ncbi:hypothetical protein D3C72_1904210 [compost metagenome]